MSSLHKQRLLHEETLRTSLAKHIIGADQSETASFKDDREVLEFIINAVQELSEDQPLMRIEIDH